MIRGISFWLLTLLLLFDAHEASCALFGKFTEPISYTPGTKIPITVNSLTSKRGLLPYNFYSVKNCQPDKRRMREERVKENLGEILLGNRILPSMYSVEVLENITCREICFVAFSESNMRHLKKLVDQQYRGNMFLAGIPLLEKVDNDVKDAQFRVGYRLGVATENDASKNIIIHNFLRFTVTYVPSESGGISITGFYVKPTSINAISSCPDPDAANDGTLTPVTSDVWDFKHFYSVKWVLDEENNGDFVRTRWDILARTGRPGARRGHWMAILNSLALLCFLGIVVLAIFARTVRKDLLVYANDDLTEEGAEEAGWKLVRGDVFRSPPNALIFTAFVSTGCQVLLMGGVVIIATFLGIVHPSQRGNLLTSIILFFCFASSISGYVAGRLLKLFRKQSWKNGFTAVTLVPGSILFVYMMVNVIHWIKQDSTAISFTNLLTILFLWVAVPIPLSFLGLSAGFRAEMLSTPSKVSSIPRIVPGKSLNRRCLYVLGGGLVPFTAAFVEIVYVLGSFWRGEPFYYFGYLTAIFLVVGFICAEVTVVVTYGILSEEDYQWWWVSFLTAGSSGLYFFLYSIVYLFTVLEIRQVLSIVLYYVYTMGVSVLLSLAMGTLGFLASAFFVRTIYGGIKAD